MPIPRRKGLIIYKADIKGWSFGVRFLDENGKSTTKSENKNPWNNKKSKKKCTKR